MSNYDDYITGTDKPFAENINDALLLSNVFDLTVPIQVPTMFNDGTWIDTVGRRKCGVAIVTLKEQLPSGVSISTVDGKSVLTGTGTVKLGFYPNFNSFGKIKSISWENTGTVQINLKTVNNTTILSDIPKGIIQNSTTELRKLQEIVIEIVLNNSTLKTLDVVMENKQQTRYGAEAGISDVTGLESRLTNIEDKDTVQDGRLTALEGISSQLFDLVYPVGSIYMSVNSTNPQILFGGIWERIQDKFLLASGTYANGSTGGSADAVVVQHNHTQNAHNHTQNSHSHGTNSSEYDKFLTYSGTNIAVNSVGRRWTESDGGVFYVYEQSGDGGINEPTRTGNTTATNNSSTATNNATGVSGTGKNMPPYLAVYMWKRTA